MAEAGCQAICFGVESGNQEVLDLVKKKSNLDKVKEAMRMLVYYLAQLTVLRRRMREEQAAFGETAIEVDAKLNSP